MSFFKNILTKDDPIHSYADFWKWFTKHEKSFHRVVKRHDNIEKDFFDKINPKLEQLGEGFFFLTGMLDDETAELVVTADGNLKKMVFVEELIAEAPVIRGWKFTAHKPPIDVKNVSVHMHGFEFGDKNLSFYANEDSKYPDEIDIVVVHDDLTTENKHEITSGIYIFLDNYLGELDFAMNIDSLSVVNKSLAEKPLIPIEKLKSYLTWRQKEFVERYDGKRFDTMNDQCTVFETELEDGTTLIATIDTDLVSWDAKGSHPWIVVVEIEFDGSANNGMPDNDTFALLEEIQEKIMLQLKDHEGYLNVGRQTSNNLREVFFACMDFRQPSKVLHAITKEYSGQTEIRFEIYLDKYWKTFDRYNAALNGLS